MFQEAAGSLEPGSPPSGPGFTLPLGAPGLGLGVPHSVESGSHSSLASSEGLPLSVLFGQWASCGEGPRLKGKRREGDPGQVSHKFTRSIAFKFC